MTDLADYIYPERPKELNFIWFKNEYSIIRGIYAVVPEDQQWAHRAESSHVLTLFWLALGLEVWGGSAPDSLHLRTWPRASSPARSCPSQSEGGVNLWLQTQLHITLLHTEPDLTFKQYQSKHHYTDIICLTLLKKNEKKKKKADYWVWPFLLLTLK